MEKIGGAEGTGASENKVLMVLGFSESESFPHKSLYQLKGEYQGFEDHPGALSQGT